FAAVAALAYAGWGTWTRLRDWHGGRSAGQIAGDTTRSAVAATSSAANRATLDAAVTAARDGYRAIDAAVPGLSWDAKVRGVGAAVEERVGVLLEQHLSDEWEIAHDIEVLNHA